MQSFAQSITKYNERKGRMIYKDFKELSLSRLGMGNMRLPTKLGQINQKKAQEIIDYAMEQCHHGLKRYEYDGPDP